MAERMASVEDHWTRHGVLARIDAALAELGHDPQNPAPEILATIEHLHTGGLATTRDQAERIGLTKDNRVLDIGCGMGGPARYLARTYGCRVDGIDLAPELIETGQVLTERCRLEDRIALRLGNALELPYPDQIFDVVWCQNVTMNIADKPGFLANVFRVLKPGGLFTSTEFSLGPAGDIVYPLTWAYDASINFLDPEDVMRSRFQAAGFRIREWMNYTDSIIEQSKQSRPARSKLSTRLVIGDDLAERQRNTLRNLVEKRIVYWMIVAARP